MITFFSMEPHPYLNVYQNVTFLMETDPLFNPRHKLMLHYITSLIDVVRSRKLHEMLTTASTSPRRQL